MEHKVQITGVVWYRKSDWPAVRDIMEDADKLPATFEKWLYRAEKALRTIEKAGRVAVKAYIDPDEFPRWCAARGLNVDAHARDAFANTVAREAIMRNQH